MFKTFLIFLFVLFCYSLGFSDDKLINPQEWVNKLLEKEKVLKIKEQQLQEKERELQLLMQEIKKENNSLVLMKRQVEDNLTRQRAEMNDNFTKQMKELTNLKSNLEELKRDLQSAEDENLDKLATFYANAKAKDAAKIISKMDIKKAVKLFQRMRPMAAGEILSALGRLDPEFASRISERLTSFDNITDQQNEN
jgi:flagellar motility protein MotE (MotC chaperone)